MTGRCIVILPTYNRAHTLARTLDSLLAQTDPDWRCYVLDDGSTDATRALLLDYTARDQRILYERYGHQGATAMNEFGMTLACDPTWGGTFWTRLGSDDWFLPRKIELDRLALAEHGACFGPYQHREVFAGPWRGDPAWSDELNIPNPARQTLLGGGFAASWANIAMRTDVLRQVRDAFGNFVDPRLRNMEDYLFNVRAARFTEFAWRAASVDGRHVIVGATWRDQVPWPYAPDARYTVAADSATYGASAEWAVRDDAHMTLVCRGDDHARGIPVAVLLPPTCVILETGRQATYAGDGSGIA